MKLQPHLHFQEPAAKFEPLEFYSNCLMSNVANAGHYMAWMSMEGWEMLLMRYG